MPRSINLLNLLTVFARIAGPLSQSNPGATTEGATARMTGFHFLQNNVDLPCHKMHVLLLRSNNPVKRIRPNLVSTAEAWIPEKQFHEFATGTSRLLGTCLAGSTHQIHSQQSWGQSISMQT